MKLTKVSKGKGDGTASYEVEGNYTFGELADEILSRNESGNITVQSNWQVQAVFDYKNDKLSRPIRSKGKSLIVKKAYAVGGNGIMKYNVVV